jgi:hypothetical protein
MSGMRGIGGRANTSGRANQDFRDAQQAYTSTPAPRPSAGGIGGGASFRDAARGQQTADPLTPKPVQSPPPSSPRAGGDDSWVDEMRAKLLDRDKVEVGAHHDITCAAPYQVVFVQDGTGSLGENVIEVLVRAPGLWREVTKYLGTENVEFLFMLYFDARQDTCAPLQVTRLARGEKGLIEQVSSLKVHYGKGGGNGRESAEAAAAYLLAKVSRAGVRQSWTFFCADEPGYDDADVRDINSLTGPIEAPSTTREVFDKLALRTDVYGIIFPDGMNYKRKISGWDAQAWWEDMLGHSAERPRVTTLADPRRLADVVVGAIAQSVGKVDQFMSDLASRQAGSKFADVNVNTVRQSIARLSVPSQGLTAPAASQRKSFLDI